MKTNVSIYDADSYIGMDSLEKCSSAIGVSSDISHQRNKIYRNDVIFKETSNKMSSEVTSCGKTDCQLTLVNHNSPPTTNENVRSTTEEQPVKAHIIGSNGHTIAVPDLVITTRNEKAKDNYKDHHRDAVSISLSLFKNNHQTYSNKHHLRRLIETLQSEKQHLQKECSILETNYTQSTVENLSSKRVLLHLHYLVQSFKIKNESQIIQISKLTNDIDVLQKREQHKIEYLGKAMDDLKICHNFNVQRTKWFEFHYGILYDNYNRLQLMNYHNYYNTKRDSRSSDNNSGAEIYGSAQAFPLTIKNNHSDSGSHTKANDNDSIGSTTNRGESNGIDLHCLQPQQNSITMAEDIVINKDKKKDSSHSPCDNRSNLKNTVHRQQYATLQQPSLSQQHQWAYYGPSHNSTPCVQHHYMPYQSVYHNNLLPQNIAHSTILKTNNTAGFSENHKNGYNHSQSSQMSHLCKTSQSVTSNISPTKQRKRNNNALDGSHFAKGMPKRQRLCRHEHEK